MGLFDEDCGIEVPKIKNHIENDNIGLYINDSTFSQWSIHFGKPFISKQVLRNHLKEIVGDIGVHMLKDAQLIKEHVKEHLPTLEQCECKGFWGETTMVFYAKTTKNNKRLELFKAKFRLNSQGKQMVI